MSTRSTVSESAESSRSESSLWHYEYELLLEDSNIIIMEVCLDYKNSASYLWYTIQSVNDLTYGVDKVISNSATSHVLPVYELLNIPCKTVGKWIPSTILGHFRSGLYMMRSAYTALRVLSKLRRNRQNIVITDSHCIAIPILTKLGCCKVIHLESFEKTLSNTNDTNIVSRLFRRILRPLRNMCLSRAETIITPCENVAEEIREELELMAYSLYPPATGETIDNIEMNLEQHVSRHLIRPINQLNRFFDLLDDDTIFLHFVAVGPYSSQSNFEVIIHAFVIILNEVEPAQRPRLSLVIVGTANSPQQYEYRNQLQSYVRNFSSQITLHVNMTAEQRWVMYWNAFAILNANIEAPYVRPILEAFFFSRLVITVQSEFVKYVVDDGVCGIIVDLEPEDFASVMLDALTTDQPFYRFIALRAGEQYKNEYSYDSFVYNWHNFLASVEN